jgi:hypothetical protein
MLLPCVLTTTAKPQQAYPQQRAAQQIKGLLRLCTSQLGHLPITFSECQAA